MMPRAPWAAVLAFCGFWPLTLGAQQNAKPAEFDKVLEGKLESLLSSLDGVMGYAVVDLTDDRRFAHLENDVFPTASTIKLTILYELFKQTEEGRVRLDEVRPFDRKQAVAGTGVLRELTSASMSLRDYATLMVVLSDNTATNILIDVVGMDRVNERMRGLGLTQTKLRRKMIDLAAARRGEENVSTPAELVKLLQVIYRGDGLSKESRDAIVEILEKDKSTPMRQGIPADVPVANKPGGLEGVAVDAGIVFLKDRPYIFAAMTTFLEQEETGDAAIAAASKAVYERFARLAHASEYGRAIK